MPAYNEATIIERSLGELLAGLRSRGEPFEIVVVENGSTDDTERRARALASPHSHPRVLHPDGGRYRGPLPPGLLHPPGRNVVPLRFAHFAPAVLDRTL